MDTVGGFVWSSAVVVAVGAHTLGVILSISVWAPVNHKLSFLSLVHPPAHQTWGVKVRVCDRTG